MSRIVQYIGAIRCDCGVPIRVEDDWGQGARCFYHGQGEAVLVVTDAELLAYPGRHDEAVYLHWVTLWLARIHAYERIEARPIVHDAITNPV